MLTLNDGRTELWQWDTGSTLAVDADCSQVHFSNKVFGRSIDVDVVDGIAIIPDILLQTDKDLTAWAFVGTAENGYTKISNVFKVNKRNKPADYVFTPPEQTSLGELIERLDKIEEEQIPDAVKNAVEDYLEKNPVDVQSVNGKKGAVQLSASDVGARPDNWMPTASDVGALPSSTVIPTVPTKVSAFTNDAGYLTEHQDLSEYAKKTEIPSVPVKSVNGKTGAVQLSASDVGARPNTWMPTAQDVGALPSTYTPPNQTAEQVGADPKGTAENAVSQHNTSDDAHNDIRLELKAINDRLTAFFDSDDQTLDELSEIVSYITNNKTLIESITTSKVSVADIVNNLTTNVSNKPLSAAQGVVLKGLIDTLSNSLSNYQTKGDYALRSELPTVPTNVSAFTNDAGYLKEHQDVSGKLDADKLPEAVNDALAQAKASGEFDGADGKDGTSPTVSVSAIEGGHRITITDTNGTNTVDVMDGSDGQNGNDGATGRGIETIARTSGNGAAGTTDTYTITYTDNTTSTFAVYNGKDGSNGKDGTSVTVANVSESTADGGNNVVTFSDGKTITVKNGGKGGKGDKGDTGLAGYTPVKGTDYWTAADKSAMVSDVLAALPTWNGGSY